MSGELKSCGCAVRHPANPVLTGADVPALIMTDGDRAWTQTAYPVLQLYRPEVTDDEE